jgi:hypothetical protein
MTLDEKQRLFPYAIARLILWAYDQGYELTIANSQHLSIDLNLFRGGRCLQFSEQHRPLGEFWKSLHPDNRWGGDFRPRPDGSHYSMEHEGVK